MIPSERREQYLSAAVMRGGPDGEQKTYGQIAAHFGVNVPQAFYMVKKGRAIQAQRQRMKDDAERVSAIPAEIILNALPNLGRARKPWQEVWTPAKQELELRRESRRG